MEIMTRRGFMIFCPENHRIDIAASRCLWDKKHLLYTAGSYHIEWKKRYFHE